MKRLIPIFLALLPIASQSAGPYCFTEPVPPGVTHCGVLIDDNPKLVIPVTNTAGVLTCEADVAGVTSTTHTCRFTSIANNALWGNAESAPSTVPFSFSKPAPPPPPVVMGLKP